MQEMVETRSTSSFFTRYKKSVVSFLLFIAYAAAVFWSNFDSLRQLQSDALRQFQLESEKQSAAISYYFSERRNDIFELASAETILNFFINRDLGMTFQYGLGVNIELIEERLEEVAQRKRVGEQAIYNGFLLIDSDGVPVAGWNAPDVAEGYSNWLAPTNHETRILPMAKGREHDTLISAPVWINRVYRGELLAWTSASTSLAQFGQSSAPWRSFLVDRQTGEPLDRGISAALVRTPAGVALAEQAVLGGSSIVTVNGESTNKMAIAQSDIRQTPFAFVSVSTEFPSDRGSSRLILLAVGVLPLIVLLIAVLDILERRRLEDLQEEARIEAERLARARSEFLANMSHEIRTPMNAIIGMSDLCLPTAVNEKQRNYLTKIQSASNSLLCIVNDILDFSKIESGKLEVEHIPFELDAIFDDLASLFAEKAEQKSLEIVFDADRSTSDIFIGDPLRLKQVLTNLLSNAIKFSEQGTIIVRARAESLEKEALTLAPVATSPAFARLRIEVIDEGIGLSDAQQSRLFNAFSQADATTTRRYGGTGLGLAICKRLVELMGGEIGVDSRFAAGSNFHFFVQLGRDSARLSSAARMAELLAPHAACPVLVVDATPAGRAAIASQLGQLGLIAELHACCESAMALLSEPQPPMLLALMIVGGATDCDSELAIRRLRAQLGHEAAPPVILLGNVSEEGGSGGRGGAGKTGQSTFSHAFDGVVSKPLCLSRLFAVLAGFVGVRERPHLVQDSTSSSPLTPQIDLAAFVGVEVLLVDDVLLNREVVTDMLTGVGMRVRVAANGQEALDAVAEHQPDCVLMDCQMPVMDGYEATRKLREATPSRNLPIIALTANALPSERQRCLDAGMDAYLAKPVRAHELLATLQANLPVRGPARDPAQAQRGATMSTMSTVSTAAAAAVVKAPAGSGQPPALASNVINAIKVIDLALVPVLPVLPGIDREIGLRYANGKPALYRKLLHIFNESHGQAFEHDFRDAIARGDWRAAARHAHTLKSSSRMIGAAALGEFASALEESCLAQEPVATEARLNSLLTELATVRGGLDTIEAV